MTRRADTKEPENGWDVVIVGGGPAGATAALYTARGGWSTVVVDKGIHAGALGMTAKIANFPSLAEMVTGADLVRRIRAQAEGVGASFVTARITAATFSEKSKTLLAGGQAFRGRAAIIATGSMGREPSISGEERLIGRGVSYCATCDGFFFEGQDVAVVGSNDETIEEALHVARFARKVTILAPSRTLRADETLLREAEACERIAIRSSARVVEILGDDRVEGAVVETGDSRETLSVSGVFVYLQGGRPILDFAAGQLETTDDGCLRVDATFQTSVTGVFAAGDVLCKHIKQAVIAASEGAQAAIAADRHLSGRAALKPDWS